MAQRCLILYAPRTGNTEKIALKFKKHLLKAQMFIEDKLEEIAIRHPNQ
jgi:menaquinone-dependent protoporphyrinogen IX oxidase